MNDELIFAINENNEVVEYEPPYAVIEVKNENDFKILKSATDKTKKKKVIKEKTEVGSYRCPVCKAAFITGYEYSNYCGNCGQRLEWEDK